MQARRLTVVALSALLASAALAGTKAQMNLVPTPADCILTYSTCKNDGSTCTDDSECTAILAPSSKFKIDGKLLVKGTLTKVRKPDGTLVTTDPSDTTDDYILKLTLNPCIASTDIPPDNCSPNSVDVYLKVDLKNGNGKIFGDLTSVFSGDPVGTAIAIAGGGVAVKMVNPAGCPGDNSATGVASRVNLPDCENGGLLLAVPGFQKEL